MSESLLEQPDRPIGEVKRNRNGRLHAAARFPFWDRIPSTRQLDQL